MYKGLSPGGPYTLVAKHLRKVYPPKGSKKVETVAVLKNRMHVLVLRAVDATASPLSPLRLGGQNVALGPLEGFPSPPLGGQTLALWSS